MTNPIVRISLAELSIALKRQGILQQDEFPKRIIPSLREAQQSIGIELWGNDRFTVRKDVGKDDGYAARNKEVPK